MSRMHRSAALLGAAALALLVGGCERSESKVARGTVDISAIRDTIAADQEKWNQEFHAKPKNVDRLAAHYAPEAYVVTGEMNPVGGWGIRALVSGLAADPNFDLTFSSDRIDVAGSGDLAYVRGRYSERYTDPATKQVKSKAGSFLTIYKKQPDGSWKVVEDFTVPHPAPEPPLK